MTIARSQTLRRAKGYGKIEMVRPGLAAPVPRVAATTAGYYLIIPEYITSRMVCQVQNENAGVVRPGVSYLRDGKE
jgi:hypothetical protein